MLTFGEPINDRWKRRILLFKTLFRLSRYDFRLPRYRRVKRMVIFNRLLSPSLSLTRSADLSQTPDKRQTRFLEKRVSKIYRPIDGATVHNFCTILTIVNTWNPCNSATDWDIGTNQKPISIAWHFLHPLKACFIFILHSSWIFEHVLIG